MFEGLRRFKIVCFLFLISSFFHIDSLKFLDFFSSFFFWFFFIFKIFNFKIFFFFLFDLWFSYF